MDLAGEGIRDLLRELRAQAQVLNRRCIFVQVVPEVLPARTDIRYRHHCAGGQSSLHTEVPILVVWQRTGPEGRPYALPDQRGSRRSSVVVLPLEDTLLHLGTQYTNAACKEIDDRAEDEDDRQRVIGVLLADLGRLRSQIKDYFCINSETVSGATETVSQIKPKYDPKIRS